MVKYLSFILAMASITAVGQTVPHGTNHLKDIFDFDPPPHPTVLVESVRINRTEDHMYVTLGVNCPKPGWSASSAMKPPYDAEIYAAFAYEDASSATCHRETVAEKSHRKKCRGVWADLRIVFTEMMFSSDEGAKSIEPIDNEAEKRDIGTMLVPLPKLCGPKGDQQCISGGSWTYGDDEGIIKQPIPVSGQMPQTLLRAEPPKPFTVLHCPDGWHVEVWHQGEWVYVSAEGLVTPFSGYQPYVKPVIGIAAPDSKDHPAKCVRDK